MKNCGLATFKVSVHCETFLIFHAFKTIDTAETETNFMLYG